MDEMIRQGAVEGFNNGMRNVGDTVEMIAVDEENRDLESSIDRLKRGLRISRIMCIVLGVVIVAVVAARLLV